MSNKEEELDGSLFDSKEIAQIYTWGCGIDGRLGKNGIEKSVTPIHLDQSFFGNEKVVTISAGRRHTGVITSSGKCYMWGGNQGGGLGNGESSKEHSVPILMKDFLEDNLMGISCGLESTIIWSESKIWASGTIVENSRFIMIEMFDRNKKIIQVSGGALHCLVLVEKIQDGTHELYSFGLNNYGQLGIPSGERKKLKKIKIPAKKIKQIACGAYHSLVLFEDRSLYTFGYNYYQQCMKSETSNIQKPYLVDVNQVVGSKFRTNFICGGGSDTTLLSDEGEVYTCGRNVPKKAEILSIPAKIVFATSGFQTSFVVSDRGKVFAWGNSTYGEFGVEKSDKQPFQLKNIDGKFISKIRAGHYHVIALTMNVPPIEVSDSTRSKDMRSLLQSGKFSDLDLKLENSIVKVHKFILAGASPALKEICRGKENPYVIKEDPILFRYLLEFIYCGIVEVENANVKKLKEVSLKFKVEKLAALCSASTQSSGNVVLSDDNWNPISEMIDNKEFSDIVLETEGKSFYAHKAVLSVRSEKYGAEFDSGMKEAFQARIPVEVPSNLFALVLQYFYKDEVALDSANAVDVLVCASELIIPRLMQLCEEYLKSGITIENVCEVWALCEEYQALQLWKFCKFFIELEHKKISKTKGYKELPETMKEQILVKSEK